MQSFFVDNAGAKLTRLGWVVCGRSCTHFSHAHGPMQAMGQPPLTLNRVERVGRLVELLGGCAHNGFPVTYSSEDGEQVSGSPVINLEWL